MAAPDDRDKTYDIRSFSRLVERIGEHGDFQQACTDTVNEIVAALQQAAQDGGRAAATMTTKIDFKLDNGMVRVSGRVTKKLPEKKEFAGHLFVTPDNVLTLQNPRQPQLPFGRVITQDGETIRVS